MIRVSVSSIAAVRAEFARIDDALRNKAFAKTAVDVEKLVEQAADKHTKTGALFSSVFSKRISAATYEVGHDLQRAPHAVFVHWGTKPHIIKPKNRKLLRWPSGGSFVFANFVNHPGYAGDPYLTRIADQVPRIFAAHVETLLRKA